MFDNLRAKFRSAMGRAFGLTVGKSTSQALAALLLFPGQEFRRDNRAFTNVVAGAIGILVITIIIAVVVIPTITNLNKSGMDSGTVNILNTVPVLLAVVIIVAVAALLMDLFRGGQM